MTFLPLHSLSDPVLLFFFRLAVLLRNERHLFIIYENQVLNFQSNKLVCHISFMCVCVWVRLIQQNVRPFELSVASLFAQNRVSSLKRACVSCACNTTMSHINSHIYLARSHRRDLMFRFFLFRISIHKEKMKLTDREKKTMEYTKILWMCEERRFRFKMKLN